MLRIVSSILFLLCCAGNLINDVFAATDDDGGAQYVIVGVSGGLQEGFPEHVRLDYRYGEGDDVEVPAVFLGRALVRGYRSYLDVMEQDWRQYTAEPDRPLINCNVIPTGCYYHANEYWMYLVDTRQFLTILLHEPRFLSIAPDLGLIDLTAEETGDVIKYIATHERNKQGKADSNYAAFPIVTGAWYNPTSHVLSPVIYTKSDGTEVTNFPQSLALWAGVITSDGECPAVSSSEVETFDFLTGTDASTYFFDSIRTTIRAAETGRKSVEEGLSMSPSSLFSKCDKKARFGVSSDMARINYPFSPMEFQSMLSTGGFDIDFKASFVTATK